LPCDVTAAPRSPSCAVTAASAAWTPPMRPASSASRRRTAFYWPSLCPAPPCRRCRRASLRAPTTDCTTGAAPASAVITPWIGDARACDVPTWTTASTVDRAAPTTRSLTRGQSFTTVPGQRLDAEYLVDRDVRTCEVHVAFRVHGPSTERHERPAACPGRHQQDAYARQIQGLFSRRC